jgi:putative ABC transport system substrate-binding protein
MERRLPVFGPDQRFVEDGALMSYAASWTESNDRQANYVDRLLRGARPAELPMEQPTKYELIFNATTAKALGLTIPPSVLAQADRVIK